MKFGMGDTVLYSPDYPPKMGYVPQRAKATAIPDIGFCAEKNRLMKEFLRAIHELGQIQAQQAKALIENDPDFARFDLLIHMANEKKDQVKYAWLAHVDEHGC